MMPMEIHAIWRLILARNKRYTNASIIWPRRQGIEEFENANLEFVQ